MADSNAKELLRLSDAKFSKKLTLDSLWQTLSDEVYPERATFTRTRIDGDEYAEDLYTSVPAQNRRDLAYALGALTRPKNQQWFEPKAREDSLNTERAKAWFAMVRDRQRTLLYTRRANFQAAMQTSDNDVVTFGNSVIRHHESPDRSGIMVYTAEHLRDCAWAENCYREVDEVHRKFKLALRNWEQEFPGKPLPTKYRDLRENDPAAEIEIRHITMPADRYGFEPYNKILRRGRGRRGFPYVAIYIDPDGCDTLREAGYWEMPYTVRRWFLVDGSPYAYSPAAMLGLVEARLLQAQERVVLEAGERVIDPPIIATRDAVLGNVMNYAGGTTWVEADYDQRTGAPVQVLEGRGRIDIGLEYKQDTRQMLAACFFLNRLTLPSDKDMTAFEVNERISEYIRSVGPAVEPFEAHNAQILDVSFQFNLRQGHFTFGEPVTDDPNSGIRFVPPELRGSDVVFEFDGPIQLAAKRQRLIKNRETRQHAFESMAVRPEAADNFDFDRMDRDAASDIGGDPAWLIPEDEVTKMRALRAQAAQQAQAMEQAAAMIQGAQAGGQAVQSLAAANQSLPALMQDTTSDALMLPGLEPQEGMEGMEGMGADEGYVPDVNELAAA